MLRIIVFGLFLAACGTLWGQSTVWGVSYQYDAAGNRIYRGMTTITLAGTKAAKIDTAKQIPPVEEGLGDRTVKIYPNPTKGMLKVEITGGAEEDRYGVGLYDQNGALLKKEELTGNGSLSVDLSGKAPGRYFLLLEYGNERKSYKIIKQ